MLNSQLSMPENEDKKKDLLERIMQFNPGLGDINSNYYMFKKNRDIAIKSGLFTTNEISELNSFWDRYWRNLDVKNELEEACRKLPWHKRIFG